MKLSQLAGAMVALTIGMTFSQAAFAKHACNKGYGKPMYGHSPMMVPHPYKGQVPHYSYGKPAHPYGYGKDTGKHQGYGKGYGMHQGYGKGDMGGKSGYDKTAKAPAYGETPKKTATPDIVDTAVAAGSFTVLVKAVQAAGLADTLKGAGPFTVFAPSDDAFRKLPEGFVDGLIADPEKLTAVLKHHVVAGRVSAADLVEQGSVTTIMGESISLNNINVAKADIQAENGVIHVIEDVLIPR